MNIGIFDSGIGGMSLLHRAMALMPQERFLFYADTDHVPYGTKTREQVISYVDDALRFMTGYGCKAVVLACNTATAVAADRMRSKYALPIIGIEPAVKPAVAESGGKRVLVVATPLTVREEKLKGLVARVDDRHLVDLLALPRLVEFAERGEFVSGGVTRYLEEELSEYPLEDYGELVLGCTHFNYFKDTFRKLAPDHVHILDGIPGTVRQLARVLETGDGPAAAPGTEGSREKKGTEVIYFESGRKVTDAARLDYWNSLHRRLEETEKIR